MIAIETNQNGLMNIKNTLFSSFEKNLEMIAFRIKSVLKRIEENKKSSESEFTKRNTKKER